MASLGRQQIVQRLVEEHYEALYRYAYRLSGSSADAEDLTQDAFCKAQMKLDQLRDPCRVKPWLFSIVRNAFLHRIRDRRQEGAVSLDGIGDVAEPPPGPLPEVEPEQLQKALNIMPEPYRTPLILYYFDGFSYRDIAEQMDLPIGTVMSRLSRAKSFLRTRLAPQGTLAADGTVRCSGERQGV